MKELLDGSTHLIRSLTQCPVGIGIADFVYVDTSWYSFSYYLASRFIKHGLADAGICRAERLVIAVCCVQWRDITISNQDRFQWNLWTVIMYPILLYNLCRNRRNIMALACFSSEPTKG